MFEISVECSRCNKRYLPNKALTTCKKCGGALLFRYDLEEITERISKEVLARRKNSFWKFLEFLPLSSSKSIVSLGEPYTPVIKIPRKHSFGFNNVFVKDEGRLPTGTFKARGMAVAVSKLKELGIKRIAIPSAGNAASALAAYGGKAGMEVYAFMPKNTPNAILKECILLGAKTYLVDGSISHAAEIVEKLKKKYGLFNLSTNKQPYRFEGYKALAFELTEQFNWNPPENIIFPTGGGEGIIGLWKGFKELKEIGWINNIPRLILVQSSGCAPLVKAFENNDSEVRESWKNAETIAAGLKVPKPYASYLILKAIRETEGLALAVSDGEIISSIKTFMKMGIYACPEAAATLASLKRIADQSLLDRSERILLFVTGNLMKYFDVIEIERKASMVTREICPYFLD